MKKIIVLSLPFIALATQAQSPVNAAMFGTMEARSMGPGTMSGRVSAIEGVNEDN